MDILILSKTHMNHGKCCVGGITGSGRYVRLLTSNGENQPENTELSTRQVWDITYTELKNTTPPHVEDVLIQSKVIKGTLKDEVKIIDFINKQKIPVWKGGPDVLFDGLTKWTRSGSGYINKEAIPNHSVGFWISNKDLIKGEYMGIRYRYPNENKWYSLKYVGYEEAIGTIPAGTLLRVSLARWWKKDSESEECCYLQLFGWYDLN